MCRLYIAGVAIDATEETLRLAFGSFGPIRRVDMSWDSATQNKGFAFVEYELPDSAELALDQMNDKMVSGRPIKVSRPCNAPGTTAMIEGILDECRPYARLFIANVHPQIHSRDLRSVFEAFGKVRSCVILGERNPQHKGVAFVEYEDFKPMQDAVIAMNGFVLGGQALRVGKAVTLACYMPEDKGLPAAAALAMAAVTAKLQGRDKKSIALPAQNMQLVKSEDSILKRAPIENLINAVVSPAMVQAGLSDLAANLINTQDFNALLSSNSINEHRKRLIKTKDVRKLEKAQEKEHERVREEKEQKEREALMNNVPNGNTAGSKEKAKEESKNSDSKKEESKNGKHREKSPRSKRDSRDRDRKRSRDRRKSKDRDRDRKRSKDRDRKPRSRDRDKDHRKRSSKDKSPKLEKEQTTLEDVSIKGSEGRLLLMKKLVRNLKTDVILLRNLVSSKELDKELKGELEAECSQYGKVHRVIINQEKHSDSDTSESTVKIFVQFTETRYAERAHAALNKRFFAGKPIKAEYYDKEKFENKDYSG